MVIINKRVITKITVEIAFQEFFQAFTDLIDDIRNNKGNAKFSARKETLKLAASSGNVIMEMARKAYTHPLDPYTPDIIDYLANQYGYKVDHYGSFYEKEQLYRATMYVDGSHI